MAEEMRSGYLRMKTDDYASVGGGGGDDLIRSDLQELGVAARKLADHALMVVGGLGSGAIFFKLLASFAAIYLLILDRTNWRTNMLTSLLIPYIFLSLPSVMDIKCDVTPDPGYDTRMTSLPLLRSLVP
ncbi:Cold acclimation protein [Musa troglodytarum]|uniref:Cold acclimation protein n=1 Tax=Musa troglodytarum TaxID=320322 RepID=A0A9E7KAA7_9LILI|nr:Cold acclimation protein [Musa troglodytarum]